MSDRKIDFKVIFTVIRLAALQNARDTKSLHILTISDISLTYPLAKTLLSLFNFDSVVHMSLEFDILKKLKLPLGSLASGRFFFDCSSCE